MLGVASSAEHGRHVPLHPRHEKRGQIGCVFRAWVEGGLDSSGTLGPNVAFMYQSGASSRLASISEQSADGVLIPTTPSLMGNPNLSVSHSGLHANDALRSLTINQRNKLFNKHSKANTHKRQLSATSPMVGSHK